MATVTSEQALGSLAANVHGGVLRPRGGVHLPALFPGNGDVPVRPEELRGGGASPAAPQPRRVQRGSGRLLGAVEGFCGQRRPAYLHSLEVDHSRERRAALFLRHLDGDSG